MPAAAFIPLIISAASTAAEVGTQVYSAKKAAKQQKEAGNAALGIQQQAFSPYINAGNASLSRLNQFLTPQGQTPSNIMAPMGQSPQQGGMVDLIAPDGTRASRPASELDHWLKLGAKQAPPPPPPGSGMGGGGIGGRSMAQMLAGGR